MPSSVTSRRSCSSRSSVASRRSSGSRSATGPISDAGLLEIGGKVGKGAAERFGSVQKALKTVQTDNRGGVSRGEVRNLLGDYGVSRRAADQFFDRLDTSGESTVDIRELGGMLSESATQPTDQIRDGEAGAGNVADVRTIKFEPPARRQASEKSSSSIVSKSSSELVMPGQPRYMYMHRRPKCSTECAKKLSQKDFDEIIDTIGVAAARKFVTIRDAFRDLDRDKSGTIGRNEMKRLFSQYGFSYDAANQFFDKVDEDGSGEVSYKEFAHYFVPYIQPAPYPGHINRFNEHKEEFGRRTAGEPTSQVVGSVTSTVGLQPDTLQGKERVSPKELDRIVDVMNDVVGRKYTTVRGAFRAIDKDYSGQIGKDEVRQFFRNYGYAAPVADQFFELIDTNGDGQLTQYEFAKHFSSAIEFQSHLGSTDYEKHFMDPNNERFKKFGRSTTSAGIASMEGHTLTDSEIQEAVKTVGTACSRRFVNVRDAFQSIDRRKKGNISRGDMREFFHNYGYDKSAADKFMDLIDADHSGICTYAEFGKYFEPYISPHSYCGHISSGRDLPQEVGGPATALVHGSTSANMKDSMDDRKELSDEQLEKVIRSIGKGASLRHNSIRGAFMCTDRDRSGTVSRYETQEFFKLYGYGPSVADQFFKKLDDDGSGEISFNEFAAYFAEDIEPGRISPKEQSTPKRTRKHLRCPDWEIHRKGTDGMPEQTSRSQQREALRRSASEPAKPERKQRNRDKIRDGRPAGVNLKDEAQRLKARERNDPERRRPPPTTHDSHLIAADFADLAEQVAIAAARKHKTIHKTLRHMDKDHTGKVSKAEVEELFHNFNFSQEQADSFVEFLDPENTGKVGYDTLMDHLMPHSLRHDDEDEKDRANVVLSTSRYIEEIKHPAVCAALGSIGRKAEAKYGSLRKALRRVTDTDGPIVTRQDNQNFFRKYGHAGVADKFFDHMDRDHRGEIEFNHFQDQFAKHLEDISNTELKDMYQQPEFLERMESRSRGSCRGSSTRSGGSEFETTYMSSYSASSCGSSVR